MPQALHLIGRTLHSPEGRRAPRASIEIRASLIVNAIEISKEAITL